MILFIDDERRRMKSYVEELEDSGYEVEFESEVDSALNFFENNHEKIDIVILDVMMPPGTLFDKYQTQMGLRTGVSLYKIFRNKNHKLPIIFFSNVSSHKLLSYTDDRTLFYEKDNFIPKKLAKQITKVLSKF